MLCAQGGGCVTDTADTVTVPTVAAVWVGLEGIGGQIPSPSLESVVPARGTLPLSRGVVVAQTPTSRKIIPSKNEDALKRHLVSLSLAIGILSQCSPWD